MVREQGAVDWAAEDFRVLLRLGRTRGHRLWTAGERQVLARVDALGPCGLELLARLTSRKGGLFHRDELDRYGPARVRKGLAELLVCGVISTQATRAQRLAAARMRELKALCRELGMRCSGRRAVLVERLQALGVAPRLHLVVLRYPSLWLRLDRLALGSLHPDRSRWVRSRLGLTRWLEYELTGGATVFSSRGACRRWEHRVQAPGGVEQWLTWMEESGTEWPPGRLDPRPRWKKAVALEARQLERRGSHAKAVTLYERLAPMLPPGSIATRWARALEVADHPRRALRLLEHARDEATLADRIGIERAGRRLARTLNRAWAPSAPLIQASSRRLQILERSHEDIATPSAQRSVEDAVADTLRSEGLEVVRAEGPWLMMVFALLCADLYVLPVAGVLPTPFLRAPLDFGTPAFYAARACEVDALWTQIRAGHAYRMGCEAWSTWAGVQMSGARWRRFEPEDVLPWLGRLEPGVLIALLEAILTQGRAAAAGIPDLLVHAPSAVRLTAAFPSRVPEGSCFVEVKGPGDSLRDAQRAWHHRLRRAGGRVEVLWVT